MGKEIISGRRGGADVKLPRGQYLTTDFPVLSRGPTPHVPLERWEFTIDDGTGALRRWNWESFRDLPVDTFMADLHCVTRRRNHIQRKRKGEIHAFQG